MSLDQTQAQGTEEQRRAQALSLQRARPPIDVPGYSPQRFLGAGAYGEVWVAIDNNTGRQVAIKFYAHRGGLDSSILSREVEKLAFLHADRYVVQLLDVGWESVPPYYVMEYVEQGSLEDRLRRKGPLRVHEAVNLFTDVAVGLLHAHGKGVLHCDLKPGNVLLDQDQKPRLADFGQSRLSHEQRPALGTLFYMAPEQADLQAMPDARWDVYALGALLYCMLVGSPPHRHDEAVTEIERAEDLSERLARYRRVIESSPLPSDHRRVPGVDRALAEIVDRCLAVNPAERFANVQAVLDALEGRARRRARLPLMILGAVGPLLLLTLLSIVAWRWFSDSIEQTSRALTERALQSLDFAGRSVATVAADELERRFETVERIASDPQIVASLQEIADDAELQPLLRRLSDPALRTQLEAERKTLRAPSKPGPGLPVPPDQRPAAVKRLDARMAQLTAGNDRFEIASWFVTDGLGIQLLRIEPSDTTGQNYSWRSYFHGGSRDESEDWRPLPGQHVSRTQLSAVYRSRSSKHWSVAISTPVFSAAGPARRFLGVVAVSFPVRGKFIELGEGDQQFSVLVDTRPGDHQGLILQHPAFDVLAESDPGHLDRLAHFRLDPAEIPVPRDGDDDYRDPLGEAGGLPKFSGRWLAAQRPVRFQGHDTGWVVLVQESFAHAIGGELAQLRRAFLVNGLLAVAAVAGVLGLTWWLVMRSLSVGTNAFSAEPSSQVRLPETLTFQATQRQSP